MLSRRKGNIIETKLKEITLIIDVLNRYRDVLSDQMNHSLERKLQSLYEQLLEGGVRIEQKGLEKVIEKDESNHSETTIPKIIHYCWFGKGEFSSLTKKCIDSWKSYCPDFEIIEWNEDNFDLNSNRYVKEAYDCKQYAFVSDYVRAYVLYHYGGLYLDTDLELVKGLDSFMDHDAFSCFENPSFIQTALLGSKKGFPIIKELLDYYEERSFVNNGIFDQTTNVYILSNLCDHHGFIRNGQQQSFDGFMIYPQDYFCPLFFDSSETCFTENTHAIHHFSKSWWK